MYVTDTPVIDRMFNPAPMDVASELRDVMDDRIRGGETPLWAHFRKLILDEVGFAREHLAGPALDRFDECVESVVELSAADETDRRLAALNEWSDELATRLAAIQ